VQEALWNPDPDDDGGAGGRERTGPRPAAPPRRAARDAYRRRGLDRCPRCGQAVEVFQLALGEGYDAVVPGEYPSARVAQDAAGHLVRGRLWPGRDSGGWSRIVHRAVCPDEAMPEDPELLAMWRALRVRKRAQAEAQAAEAKTAGGQAEAGGEAKPGPKRGGGGKRD
jgi:Family of unknown function (DUF6083)